MAPVVRNQGALQPVECGAVKVNAQKRAGVMRRFLRVLAAGLSAVSVAPLAAAAAARADRPNIILLLADDLGAKELACCGNREHQTPHLDRLASEGMRFETFYANPLCTPTRVALMTGQYGFHNGFLGMQDPAFKPAPQSPQSQIGNHFTHADLLKSRGYATALAGKWQLAKRDGNQDGLIDHDESMSTLAGNDKAAGEARFRKLDLDHDGRLTREEFLGITGATTE